MLYPAELRARTGELITRSLPAHKPGRNPVMDTQISGPTLVAMRAGSTEQGKQEGTEPSRPASGSTAPPPKKGRDPLLAGICHDLRAPLAAVTMGANFVYQTMPADESTARSRRVLSAILRSCKQMERLVRDFGDYSEVEGDAVELRTSVLDAAEMAELASQGAKDDAAARKVTVRVNRPAGAGAIVVQGDRDRLLRALAHVLDNAVRFSPEGGEIVVAVADESTNSGPSEVRFSITDRGPGISEETLAHLYDRGWLIKRPNRSGAGLGLAIARGIFAAHGGRIEVQTKDGGPTTVSLVMPKEQPVTPDLDATRH